MEKEGTSQPLTYASPGTVAPKPDARRGCLIAAGVCTAVLLGLGWWAIERATRFDISLEVANLSASPIGRMEFYFGGKAIAFDNIAPGTTVRGNVTLRGSGQLTYAFPLKSEYPPGVAAEYLDEDCIGYKIRLRIEGGTVTSH